MAVLVGVELALEDGGAGALGGRVVLRGRAWQAPRRARHKRAALTPAAIRDNGSEAAPARCR